MSDNPVTLCPATMHRIPCFIARIVNTSTELIPVIAHLLSY